jgi:hypothetical protein
LTDDFLKIAQETMMPNPRAYADDTDAMCEAITAFTEAGARFSRPSRYQLKVGDLSFYPDTGKIFRDGEREVWEQRGLDAFVSSLRKLKQSNTKGVKLKLVDTQDSPPDLDLSSLRLVEN